MGSVLQDEEKGHGVGDINSATDEKRVVQHDDNSASDEKHNVQHDDNINTAPPEYTPKSDPAAIARARGFEPPEIIRNMSPEYRIEVENRLRRKIDTRLMPMIVLMYLMNYLDRVSF